MDIKIIGAFDRYNYGDLLFPIIAKLYLDQLLPCEKTYQYFALTASDLTSVGGLKTKRLEHLYFNVKKDDVFIVAGGEVLCASISSLDLDSTSNYLFYVAKKILYRIFGKNIANRLARNVHKLPNDYPFIINKEFFNNKPLLTYNAVGGHDLINKSMWEKEIILLNKYSNYISVRDKTTYTALENTKKYLYPDSAVSMSKYFTKEKLLELMDSKTRKYIQENNYICFQTNLRTFKKNKNVIEYEIVKILNKGIKVVLLPIGFATNHDDTIALAQLNRKLPNTVLFDKINIFSVMGLIAHADFFIGTSLHGNITAISYAIPHIGFNKDIGKLNEFLKTWDIEPFHHCYDIENLSEMVFKHIYSKSDELQINRDILINYVNENFEKIKETIMISNNSL